MKISKLVSPAGSSTKLFYGLSKAELDSMLLDASKLRFHRNSVAVNQGHPADRLYLLIHGRARFFIITEQGQKIILRWIVPGQVFGASAVTNKPSTYLVGTEITHDSVVLSWNRSQIRRLSGRFPHLMENMFSIAQEYLDWYVAAHEALTSQNARQRLAQLLIRLTQSIGQAVSGGVSIDVKNEELASAANLTVFTVSRLLREWQDSRAITKSRNKLVVRSPPLLFESGKDLAEHAE